MSGIASELTADADAVGADAMGDISKRIDDIGSRIDKVMAVPKKPAKNGADEAAHGLPNPEPAMTYCTHLPTSDQTNGIEPFYVRMCATISGDEYSHKSKKSEFVNLSTGYNLSDVGLKEPPKVVLYDNNGPFEPTNPPFVAVVVGTKLVLAWRGSVTLVDWIRDFGFFVSSSFRWKNVAKVVKVHGGFLAMVDNTMAMHEDRLLEIVKEYGIKQILLTGHSLAGGAAQVAQLWFEGTMDPSFDPRPNEWKKLAKETGLTVHCMSFEGPSTTVYVESKEDEDLNQMGRAFINQCGAKMCTTVYSMDPVPRLIGGVPFVLSILENFMTAYEKNSSYFERHFERGAMSIIKYELVKFKIPNPLNTVEPIAQRYQHIGKCLYYASHTAVPEVYIDNNKYKILVDKEGKPQSFPDLFSIKYVQCEKDVVDAVIFNHDYIVHGPGLSFHRTP